MDPAVLRMIHYVHANYRTDLSLRTISDQLFISPSWASKIFLKGTGEHFLAYVKRIRLESAKHELEQTDHAVTQVAMDNGFSTPSAFNRDFKNAFGMTPKEHRSLYRKRPETAMTKGQERNRLRQILEENQALSASDLKKQQVIHADTENMHVWKKSRNEVLNAGPAHALASASLQKQILFLTDRLGITYLRIWNVFSPRLMVLGNAPGQYNFTFLDEMISHRVILAETEMHIIGNPFVTV